jgi:hypothetical protein
MRTTAAILSLSLLSAAAAIASGKFVSEASAQYPGARIWVDNDRDYFRRGDRLRINFSTSANSYVAIVHVDPDGYLEFLYPSSPWDAEFVRGGRVHSVDRAGWSNGLVVRGTGGIGYLYVIASPVPLDYTRFSAGSGWDWSYAGRSVSGDPFWAMEQITRTLLPGWGNVPYAADYFTYYVGGVHRYPSYACSSRGYSDGWGWGYSSAWSSYYGSCDRLDYFLRDNPYYFDSRRYRGDRRVYYDRYRDYRDWDPRHGYKTDPAVNTQRAGARIQTAPQSAERARVAPVTGTSAPTSRPAQRAEPARPISEPRTVAPRPTTRQAAPASSTPEPRPRATSPRPVERQPEAAPSPPRQTTTPRAAPARPTSTPRAAPADRPTRTAPSAAPSSRGSAGSGSSSATPRSRRGGD